MEFVDLTHPLNARTQIYPGDPEFSCCPALTLLKDGVNVQAISLGSHTGTHVDAPYHFFEDGARVDQLPLSRFVGPALVIDVSCKQPEQVITWADLASHVDNIRSQLTTENPIVLLRTSWSQYWGTERYLHHPFLHPDAARRLVDAGVKALGIDCLSPDKTSHDGTFEVHRIMLGAGCIIVENLTKLDTIQEPGWMVNFVPLRLEGSDGSPIRAFAWRYNNL